MSSNEETIARAIGEVIRPLLDRLQERIRQLESEGIALRAEVRLLKELTLSNCRDEKHLLLPGERAHRLGAAN
jgi:hypothetical protein